MTPALQPRIPRPGWAEAVAAVPRTAAQRWHTERLLQWLRHAATLLAVGLALNLGGGPGGGLWVAVGLLLATSAVVETGLHRHRATRAVRRLGVLAFAGDTAATMVILALVSQDPSDPVVTLAVILALEAAVRWQLGGAVAGGVLGGTFAAAWLFVAHRALTASPPPVEHLLFRFASVLLVAVLVGAMVREMERARHRAGTILELTPELVLTLDGAGRIASANPAAATLLGHDPAHLVGRTWRELTGAGRDGEDPLALATPGQLVQVQLTHVERGPRWFELSVGDDPADGLRYLIGRDITDRRAAERQRSVSEQRYRALFVHNPDAVFAFDLDARIVDANPAAETLFHRSHATLVGSDALAVIAADDQQHAREALGRTLAGQAQDVEVTLVFPDGGMGHADANLLPIIVDGEVVGVFGMARDVTERRRREADLEYRASHDLLTGLANRATLIRRLEHLDTTAAAHTILFLDLDGFKAVNDTHGHAAGDHILVEVARRLQAAVRGQDLVCRFAGDEFCVLLNSGDPGDVRRVGERIAADVAAPIALEDRAVSVGVSIGAAVVRAGEDARAALARADAAMYTVKGQRRVHADGVGDEVDGHDDPDQPLLLAI